jgi:hypothetical protein
MGKILCLMFVVLGCGSGKTEYKKGQGVGNGDVAYTWDEMKNRCFTCHNGSAPAIPLDEEGFQASSKVRARIAGGSMPPAAAKGDFDAARAIAYLDKIR